MKIKNDKIIIQITCLVVSVVLWAIIMIDTKPPMKETINSVPVTIRNLSALENSNLIMMNSDKDNLTINVNVEGSPDQVSKLKRGDFSAYIDVLGFPEGITNAKVEITGPSGVEILSTYPAQIACNIEGVISKVMDVTIQYEGMLAENYYKALSLSNPSSVKITGPRSVVNAADMAVATVNIANATDNVVKTVPVRIYDGTDTEIFMSAPVENVEVIVPIYPTKYVSLTPNVTGTPEEGYQLVDVTVKPERIKIAARQDILDTINELELADLDITGASKNILSSRDILNTDGLILLDLTTTPVVNATVDKTVDKELVFEPSEINFINVKEGYEVMLSDTQTEITVTVTGPSSIVNQLKKEELTITADMEGKEIGLHDILIVCTTEKEVDSISLDQEMLNVEVIGSTENDEE
ncbi:CdaR family protein [Sedimentibacter sp.]|uniref:CdaR family protein n=1 Tax=Sedimentibacter sp. TaxID=1960295 RepID=UPI0028A91E01|nr:CdaR family protein [Sedimentibacter sp.]